MLAILFATLSPVYIEFLKLLDSKLEMSQKDIEISCNSSLILIFKIICFIVLIKDIF